MYTETAGQLAPLEEQKILQEILRERGVNLNQLRKCEVRVRSHGRRRIEFDSDDFCTIGEKGDHRLGEEFDRRRATLPE